MLSPFVFSMESPGFWLWLLMAPCLRLNFLVTWVSVSGCITQGQQVGHYMHPINKLPTWSNQIIKSQNSWIVCALAGHINRSYRNWMLQKNNIVSDFCRFESPRPFRTGLLCRLSRQLGRCSPPPKPPPLLPSLSFFPSSFSSDVRRPVAWPSSLPSADRLPSRTGGKGCMGDSQIWPCRSRFGGFRASWGKRPLRRRLMVVAARGRAGSGRL